MVKYGLIASAALLLSGCASHRAEVGNIEDVYVPNDATTIGSTLGLSYRVLANHGDGGCLLPGFDEVFAKPCYEAEIVLTSDVRLDLTNTAIYFNQVEPTARFDGSSAIRIEHLNGDLHRLSFDQGAVELSPSEPLRIAFIVRGVALTRGKFMPNYYVVDAQGRTAIIDSTREVASEAMGRKELPFLAPLPDDLRRSGRDLTQIETPEMTFKLNAGVEFVREAVDTGIVPNPAHVSTSESGSRVDLSKGLAPTISGATGTAFDAAFKRLELFGIARKSDGLPLELAVDEELAIPAEGYELSLQPERILIRAADEAGAFYALQSIAALVRPGTTDIPAMEIEDAPRFGFRGMHVDIARNFHGPETLRALIDQMAAYKLNKLHLHLADDEGWRLEIDGLPELTEIGSKRCHDPLETHCLLPQLGSGPDATSSGSGYLSADEYVALLRYAAARHVEVIPALDMPGHARAAIKAMDARYARLKAAGMSEEVAGEFLLSDPEDTTVYESFQYYSDNTINVCRPSSYRFVAHVLDRVMALQQRAGAPLRRYHIGADETAGAWKQSPLCAAFLASGKGPTKFEDLGGYFVSRVAHMVADRGVAPAAWSDGATHAEEHNPPAQLQSNIWGTLAWGANATANRHANRGWGVVISIPDATYFDFPYAAHPEEGGYYWAIRRAPTRKLFSMMPENLPALAAYWKDRDDQPFTIDDRPANGDAPHRPLTNGSQFLGLQGHIWSETVRDRETLGYQIFPRMLALAERTWSRAGWEIPYDHAGRQVTFGDPVLDTDRQTAMQRDWNRFASLIAAKELTKLELADWSYRLPPPGAQFVDGKLQVNTDIPGLPVQCGSRRGWVALEHCAIEPEIGVHLRATSWSGTRVSRAVSVIQSWK